MNIVKGDLLTLAEQGHFDIIVQGCNCFCSMGAGLAVQIKEKYPQAYVVDMNTESGDYNKLGNYTIADCETFSIVNAYTQYGVNSIFTNNDLFEYDSFSLILQKLAYKYPTSRFGFPMIGMGLAGGNKVKIMGMLAEFSLKISETGGSFTLVEYEK